MPTDKRARQKEGRRVRLEAQRKVQRRRQLVRRTVIVVAVAAVVLVTVYVFIPHGSTPTTTTTTTSTSTTTTSTTIPQTSTERALQARADAVAVRAGCPRSPQTTVNSLTWTSAPKMTIDKSATYTATFKTDVGAFTVRLDASTAPITVNNFLFLNSKGYFRCNAFFRAIPKFVIQSGSPNQSNENAQPGYTIADELPATAKDPAHQYPLGALAMANLTEPNTGGSQFFIITGSHGEALSPTYSLFGQVTAGMGVVLAIAHQGRASGSPAVVHRILSIAITKT